MSEKINQYVKFIQNEEKRLTTSTVVTPRAITNKRLDEIAPLMALARVAAPALHAAATQVAVDTAAETASKLTKKKQKQEEPEEVQTEGILQKVGSFAKTYAKDFGTEVRDRFIQNVAGERALKVARKTGLVSTPSRDVDILQPKDRPEPVKAEKPSYEPEIRRAPEPAKPAPTAASPAPTAKPTPRPAPTTSPSAPARASKPEPKPVPAPVSAQPKPTQLKPRIKLKPMSSMPAKPVIR